MPAEPSTARGGAPAQERELRAQGRKTMQRLLAAGRTVFATQGFHNARVDDIVKAAKTSHGTFYLYFSNKEDLFKALALDTMSEMEALGASLGPVSADEDGRDTIREWVTKFVDLYAAHGSVIRAWTEWELNDRELGKRAQTSLVQLSTALATRIHEVRVLDDHGLAEGLACLSMLERFNYFRESHQVDVSREEAIDILTRAVFEGFFVPDRGVSRRRPRAAAGRSSRVRKAG
ncbi:MAG TPA: TetR/AcrR family transcriptional regulator [Mycobacteriales bacterium]|jgi:AcrR family transcriptional regulator|nr:TetR/AcrR family transcriptional regulator [Mycobacteriales bacterium]